MSAALASFSAYIERSVSSIMEPITVHLMGFGNEEIEGGGYHAQPFNPNGNQFVFTGEAPRIYGYCLMDGGKRIYSEQLKQPWQALNAGDELDVQIDLDVKVKRG